MDDRTKTLWDREGGISMNGFIETLLTATYPDNPSGSPVSALVAGAHDLSLPVSTWRRAAIEAGWAHDPMAQIMHKGTTAYRGFETPDWKRLCGFLELHPNTAAPVEFRVVSDWLADQLIREGEKVRKGFSGINVWADADSGPVHENPVIIDIADTYADKLALEAVGTDVSKFEITSRSYAVGIESHRFIALLDSESYATENAAFEDGAQTLLDKLTKLPGVDRIEYNGHFGSFVYLTIDDGHDTDALKRQILEVINEHLDWCASLEIADHVVQSRKGF